MFKPPGVQDFIKGVVQGCLWTVRWCPRLHLIRRRINRQEQPRPSGLHSRLCYFVLKITLDQDHHHERGQVLRYWVKGSKGATHLVIKKSTLSTNAATPFRPPFKTMCYSMRLLWTKITIMNTANGGRVKLTPCTSPCPQKNNS